jgi:hypothetical protein
MTITPVPHVTITPIAKFPEGYFLENLVVRADGSVLITALLQRELWYVPGPAGTTQVDPVLLHTFDHLITGIVEVEPDVFVVSLSELYTTHESHLVRVDLNGWSLGEPVRPEIIFTFDDRVRALNGSCAFGPTSMLLADCFAGLIWRVDLYDHAHAAKADVWLSHDTMWPDPENEVPPPPQPGINGVRYGAKAGYVYYTNTAQQVFLRVPVDPSTLEAAGTPEFLAGIDNGDDFCIDEDAGFAYVTRHRGNGLDRVPLTPRHGGEVRHLAGVPFDPVIVGPSSAYWSREPGAMGRVMYVTTDGGTTSQPDGIRRNASLLRVELTPRAAS